MTEEERNLTWNRIDGYYDPKEFIVVNENQNTETYKPLSVIVRKGPDFSATLHLDEKSVSAEYVNIRLDSLDVPAGAAVTIYANADKQGFRTDPFFDGLYTDLQSLYGVPDGEVLVVIRRTDTEYGDLARLINRMVLVTHPDGSVKSYTSLAAIPGAGKKQGQTHRIVQKVYTLGVGDHNAETYTLGSQGEVAGTFPNNAVDFIELPDGLEIRTFAKPDFQGQQHTYTGNIPGEYTRINLREARLQNRISSVRIAKAGTFAAEDTARENTRIQGEVLTFKGCEPVMPSIEVIPETRVRLGDGEWVVLGIGDHENVPFDQLEVATGQRVKLFSGQKSDETQIAYPFYEMKYGPRDLAFFDVPETVAIVAVRGVPYKYNEFFTVGYHTRYEDENGEPQSHVVRQKIHYNAEGARQGLIEAGKHFKDNAVDYVWVHGGGRAYLAEGEWMEGKMYCFNGNSYSAETRYPVAMYGLTDNVSSMMGARGDLDKNVRAATCRLLDQAAYADGNFQADPNSVEWKFDYDVEHTAQLSAEGSGQDNILSIFFRHGVPVCANLGWFFKERTAGKHDPVLRADYFPTIDITKRDGTVVEVSDYNEFEYHQVEPYKHHYYIYDWMVWKKNGVEVEKINIKDIQHLFLA